jgi:hypothetical protein
VLNPKLLALNQVRQIFLIWLSAKSEKLVLQNPLLFLY